MENATIRTLCELALVLVTLHALELMGHASDMGQS
jgi:hypothetical protein